MKAKSDHFEIGGINAISLVEKYDSPLYVYDAAKIKTQYNSLLDSITWKQTEIHYAVKALSNINVLRIFKLLGAGLDAVSIGEVKLGLHAGFEPAQILYTPNGVGQEEMEEAISLGVRINIDNIEMLENIGHLHPELPVCIRVNPHVMAGGNRKIAVGHIDSKFGISVHQLPHVHRLIEALSVKVEGVHMHTGSDILDVEIFLQAADILFEAAEGFPDLEYIDFGSGFKVKYKSDDYATDIEDFGREIGKRFEQFCQRYGRPLTLVFEPGKYLVSESGYFLVKVNVVKQTTSTIFAGVDSGFNHLIRPMFYNAWHEITNISNPAGRPRIYSVVGYICESDTFAFARRLSEVRPGDILCFKNAGAYCFSMASQYNSRFRPAEVLIKDGKDYLIREREEFEDLLNRQVKIEDELLR